MNGTIDLTSILTGQPTFGNITGSIEFIFAPGFGRFEDIISEITAYLHGQRRQIILSDDPGYYYNGIFTIGSVRSDAKLNSIVINYSLSPSKNVVQQ